MKNSETTWPKIILYFILIGGLIFIFTKAEGIQNPSYYWGALAGVISFLWFVYVTKMATKTVKSTGVYIMPVVIKALIPFFVLPTVAILLDKSTELATLLISTGLFWFATGIIVASFIKLFKKK